MSITRAAANRQNAKASTGPRTEAGKGRAARNATRHGLAVPVSALPEFDARILSLANLVAGTNANPSRLEAARRIAEAIIDIRRVQSVRLAILDGTMVPNRKPGGAEAKALVEQGIDGDVGAAARISAVQEKRQAPSETTDAADPVLARMLDAMRELARLERYETRARSRRKFAIRDLDALGPSEGTPNVAKDE